MKELEAYFNELLSEAKSIVEAIRQQQLRLLNAEMKIEHLKAVETLKINELPNPENPNKLLYSNAEAREAAVIVRLTEDLKFKKQKSIYNSSKTELKFNAETLGVLKQQMRFLTALATQ